MFTCNFATEGQEHLLHSSVMSIFFTGLCIPGGLSSCHTPLALCKRRSMFTHFATEGQRCLLYSSTISYQMSAKACIPGGFTQPVTHISCLMTARLHPQPAPPLRDNDFYCTYSSAMSHIYIHHPLEHVHVGILGTLPSRSHTPPDC